MSNVEPVQRQYRSKLQGWLAVHEDRLGKSDKPVKSNLTDNESAKIRTGHGVIQGYAGVAAVDAKHQIIVHAQAYGQVQEHGLLLPMLAGVERQLGKSVWTQAQVTTDAGFHTEENLVQLHERKVDAYIADYQMRKRDCLPCPLRAKCLKHPEQTEVRQVAFFLGKADPHKYSFTATMKQKIGSSLGRLIYDKRLGTVEPVFGNHRNHRHDRFTLRRKIKVNTQWLLYSIVHNLGKIHAYGEGFT